MIWIILAPLIAAIIGLIMVNKVGNYENIWGAFLYGGIVLFIVFSIIGIFTKIHMVVT